MGEGAREHKETNGYEFFEHTADVGLRASGKTLTQLFIHAAEGLVALLIERGPITPREARPITLSAPSVEALLQAWLTELIVWFDTDHFVPAVYELESVSVEALRGQIRGEIFDPARHAGGVEVKGVTRHQFRVEQTDKGWEASLIFDV